MNSDHFYFWRASIPHVFFSTGPDPDMHLPANNESAINHEGMTLLADVLKRLLVAMDNQ